MQHFYLQKLLSSGDSGMYPEPPLDVIPTGRNPHWIHVLYLRVKHKTQNLVNLIKFRRLLYLYISVTKPKVVISGPL